MALKIGEKIDKVRDEIEAGLRSGSDLAELGKEAVFKGMNDPAWETLMREFTDDKTELDRLCGKDEWFMKQPWGQLCLAYIAGDSICTSMTARKTGAKRTMREDPSRGMEELIDKEPPGQKESTD